MSKPPSFPIALLGKDKAERLSYFERYRIAHPVLKAIDQRLWEVIGQAITPSLVFVFGPTGVGKTTLIERLAARLMALDSSPVKERDAYLPVLTVEAASPETGNFNWKGFYRESLIALEKSFLSQKPDYGNNKIFFDDLGNLRIPATMPVYELRTTLEGLLRKRRPNARARRPL